MWHLAYTLVRNPNLAELRRRGNGANTTADDFVIPVAYRSIFGVVNELSGKDEVKESFDSIY